MNIKTNNRPEQAGFAIGSPKTLTRSGLWLAIWVKRPNTIFGSSLP